MIYVWGRIESKCWAQEIDALSCCFVDNLSGGWGSMINSYIDCSKSGEGYHKSYSITSYTKHSTIEKKAQRELYIQDILE